jgi:hypothetical protein
MSVDRHQTKFPLVESISTYEFMSYNIKCFGRTTKASACSAGPRGRRYRCKPFNKLPSTAAGHDA